MIKEFKTEESKRQNARNGKIIFNQALYNYALQIIMWKD